MVFVLILQAPEIDNFYDYPTFMLNERSTNHTQAAEFGTTNYHFDDCCAYNISSQVMAGTSESVNLVPGGNGSENESNSSDHDCDVTRPTASDQHQNPSGNGVARRHHFSVKPS